MQKTRAADERVLHFLSVLKCLECFITVQYMAQASLFVRVKDTLQCENKAGLTLSSRVFSQFGLFIDFILDGLLSEGLNAGLFYYEEIDLNKKFHQEVIKEVVVHL